MAINVKKIIQKLQTYYFNIRLSLHRFLGLPIQTKKERQIFKTIFGQVNSGKVLRIFEWGSGLSTIYYGKYLKKRGIEFEWHSIDNNRMWHQKVQSFINKKNLALNVKLYLKEFIPFWEKPGWGEVPPPCGLFSPKSEEEIGYINQPKQFNVKFDIIIIDARFRRNCIKIAKEVLLHTGIVIMHDAQKPHYHEGLDSFTYKKFYNTGSWYPLQKELNQVWVGSIENDRIFDILEKVKL